MPSFTSLFQPRSRSIMGNSASSYVRTWSPYEKYVVPRDVFGQCDNRWNGVIKGLDEPLHEENRRRRRRRRIIGDNECVCGRRLPCAHGQDEQGWLPRRALPKWQPIPVFVVGQARPRDYAYQQPSLAQQPALQQAEDWGYLDYEDLGYGNPQLASQIRASLRGTQARRRSRPRYNPGYDPRGYAGRVRQRHQQQQQNVFMTPDDEIGDNGDVDLGEEDGIEGETPRRQRRPRRR